MRKAFLIMVAVLQYMHVFSQTGNAERRSESFKHSLLDNLMVSPKAGAFKPLNAVNDPIAFTNGLNGGVNLFMPILYRRGDQRTLTFGIEGTVDYNLFQGNQSLGILKKQFQQYSVNIVQTGSEAKASSWQIAAGPKVSLQLYKFYLSPGLQFGFLQFRSNEYAVTHQTADKQNVALFKAESNKTSGFLLRPKIEVGYRLSPRMDFWVGSFINYGPNLNFQSQIWEPSGINEIATGRYLSQKTAIPYRFMGYELGLKMLTGRGISGQTTKRPSLKKNARLNSNIMKPETEPRDNVQGEATHITPPKILFPQNGQTTALVNDLLQLSFERSNTNRVNYIVRIWNVEGKKKTLILEEAHSSDWDGVVKGLGSKYHIEQLGSNKFILQIQAVKPTDTLPKKDKIKDVTAKPSQPTSTFIDNALSATVSFNIVSNCFPNLGLALDSTRCLDSNKTKVWGHVELNNVSGITVLSILITDFKENNFSGPSVAVSNLVPGYNLPPVNNSFFSFNVDQSMCNKTLFMRATVTYTCVLTGETVTVPCADTISMPCCRCDYCADSIKIVSVNSGATGNGNLAQISQTFSVTPANIANVTAQIVYMSDSVNNEICRVCDSSVKQVYHFTGANTAAWNGGPVINAASSNSTHTFPSKIISWQSNNQGNISMSLNITLPGIANMECCSMTNKICIKYSFTDKNCKTCETVVCYTVDKKSPASGAALAN